ncbi:hypothetical protein FRC02_011575 [Tulasnella sp. 418]|nr:hypothetical protein FRC02_011575 [Tulasnella sp. 418]
MVLREAIMRDNRSITNRDVDSPLKEESKKCLKNLATYKSKHRNPYQAKRYPLSRCAAVLVALFVGRMGDLYVLLSRRSDTLRSYAGDTSLPGGKRDKGDRSPEDTARREAFEEIGLPRDKRRIPLLCTMEPFLSSNNLIVFPVVVLVTDREIRPILNTPEVAALFSHSLRSFLDLEAPLGLAFQKTSQISLQTSAEESHSNVDGEKLPYYTFEDITWGMPGTHVRIHKFLTGREPYVKPVVGLTAAILLRVAVAGYDAPAMFEMEAPNQLPMEERIRYALETIPVLMEACRKEGIKVRRRSEGSGTDKRTTHKPAENAGSSSGKMLARSKL